MFAAVCSRKLLKYSFTWCTNGSSWMGDGDRGGCDAADDGANVEDILFPSDVMSYDT